MRRDWNSNWISCNGCKTKTTNVKTLLFLSCHTEMKNVPVKMRSKICSWDSHRYSEPAYLIWTRARNPLIVISFLKNPSFLKTTVQTATIIKNLAIFFERNSVPQLLAAKIFILKQVFQLLFAVQKSKPKFTPQTYSGILNKNIAK